MGGLLERLQRVAWRQFLQVAVPLIENGSTVKRHEPGPHRTTAGVAVCVNT